MEFLARPPVSIAASIFGVRQDGLDGTLVPWCIAKICDPPLIQFPCNSGAIHSSPDEHVVDLPDATHFMGTARDLNNAVSNNALPFAGTQDLFRGSVRTDHQPPQAISRRSSLTISQLSHSFLAR